MAAWLPQVHHTVLHVESIKPAVTAYGSYNLRTDINTDRCATAWRERRVPSRLQWKRLVYTDPPVEALSIDSENAL
jgi:hypothetical protein